MTELEAAGKTVMLVGDETIAEILGILAVADQVRPDSRQTVERLCHLGVERIVMLGIATLVISNLLVGVPLPLGVVGHEESTLVVVANGLRLLAPTRL